MFQKSYFILTINFSLAFSQPLKWVLAFIGAIFSTYKNGYSEEKKCYFKHEFISFLFLPFDMKKPLN